MSYKTAIAATLLAAGTAFAGPTGTAVSTSVIMGNGGSGETMILGSGTSNLSIDPDDFGTDLGNSLGNNTVYGDYVVTPQGAAGTGPNGGNLYNVGVRVGSRSTGFPFGVNFYDSPIIDTGDTLASGATINEITFEFGIGGGGIAFDDFGAATQVSIIDDFGVFLDIDGYGAPFSDVDDGGANMHWVVNGDGTLGVSVTYSTDSVIVSNGFDFTSFVNGDWATGTVDGVKATLRVEVTPTPSSAALIGLGGLVAMRRRR
ncbi:MAG: hypothetical protein DHS20C14_01560 [Phycisphaeraceae bacterium]|nr:MAG: hypothetical protein DHS20C14_01560 [Phycisphaeraceae bacterium]